LKAAVRQELEEGRVVTCWVVKAELLIGARDAPSFETLADVLAAVREIPITDECWTHASRLGFELRKQGLLVALPDLLIAECAIIQRCVLWHADSDFENVRRLSSLQTRYWQS
jgi:predicted nucleic acid-binding protein